jgi:hypothetical protein
MADLNITTSGGVKVSGLSPVYRYTTPTAFVIVGGVFVGGANVVGHLMPGDLAVITSGGVQVGGESVIAFVTPAALTVVASGGVEVGGQSIVGTGPPVSAHVVSGGVQVGGQSVIGVTYPTLPQVLSVVTSGGVMVDGQSVVAYRLPPVLSIICSGGVVVGGFRVPELTVVQFIYPADLTTAIVGSGGAEVGGTSIITFISPPVFVVSVPHVAADADVFVGGASIIAFIHPQILQVIADGGVTIGGEPIGDGVFETIVLSGARGEPSIYSGFSFNSYCRYRGQDFGAGLDGIYLLDGKDDGGEKIHAGVRIGPFNVGTDREKRIRLLRLGGKTVGAKVRVSNGNGSVGYYDVEDGRAGVSREVQGREITIDITDFESLDHFEIVPLVLHKR